MVKGTREVKYVCSQCRAEDNPVFFENEPTLPAISCHKCHAGMKLAMEEILRTRTGMFPYQTGKK